MIHRTHVFIAAVFLLGAAAQRSEAAQLTRDGRPAAVLVVPDSSVQAQAAAERIQKVLGEMSGAGLDIVRESARRPGRLLPVYVGHTRFAASKGIRQEALKPEEIVLVANDEHVIVLGNEGPAGPDAQDVQEGTVFAAVELLHRLGVRWLWPDPTGHVIPKTKDVVLDNLDYRHAPEVVSRHMRMQVGSAFFWLNVMAKFDRRPGSEELHDWPLHMRLGRSRTIRATHAFGDWHERFFATRPELFATGSDGGFSWLHIPHRAKVCVSNPEVLEQIVADAKAYYHSIDNPENTTFSLSPNDGHGFCLCPDCRAMDHPEGREESWNVYNNATGRPETITHVSLSDRYTTFWNQVAERLEKEAPGMPLGSLAYSRYRAKPLGVEKIHPNLAIGYVGGGYANETSREVFLEEWKEWSDICDQMFWRPNLMMDGAGFPLVWATRIGEDMKWLISTGMVAVDMPGVHHHWANQGLNYYMVARIMWDHTLDPSEVIDDYCRTGFGAAAPDVRRYFGRLEELTHLFALQEAGRIEDIKRVTDEMEDPDAANVTGPRGEGASSWTVVWTDAALMELERLLVRAESLVEEGTPEAVRVSMLREGLDFAKLEVLVRRAVDKVAADESTENEYELLLAIARVEQWLLANRDSKAVAVIHGAPWWWRGKRHVGLLDRRTILGRAEPLGGNRHLLTVPAYANNGRFVSIEFSHDGRTWTEPQPYRVQHEYVAPAGTGTVLARLTFKGPDGISPLGLIEINL